MQSNLIIVLVLSTFACTPPPPKPDGGTGGGSAGGAAGGFALDAGPVSFQPFVAPTTTPVPGAFLFTISAEASATEGYAFPPAAGSTEPYFVDGWELHYQHLVTTIGSVELAENPDMNPNDPAMTGAVVARASGPWAIDLAKPGPLDAKAMEGRAVPLTRLTNQNVKSGTPPFSTTSKYAFSFETVPADGAPFDVNLDDDAKAGYQAMRDNSWSYWIQGTATFKGTMSTPACRSTNPGYDDARLPKTVTFSLGWRVPAAYKNCINQELQPMDSRGVQLGANGAEAVVQMTLHNDHPFWDALEEDAPLRFDAIAALKSVPVGMTATSATVTTADLQGVDFEALTDAQGVRLPFRYCGAVQAGERTTGGLAYDPKGVPVNPLGGVAGLKDLSDYMAYNLSTFGHLNAGEGLCVVQRKFASPP